MCASAFSYVAVLYFYRYRYSINTYAREGRKDNPLLHAAMQTGVNASWEYGLTVQTEDQAREQKKSMWIVLTLEAPASKGANVHICVLDYTKLKLDGALGQQLSSLARSELVAQ